MDLNDLYNIKCYSKINRFRRKAILRFIKKDNALVLDIGCGDGTMGETLKKEKRAEVHGLDISPRAVEAAKEKLDTTMVFDVDKNNWPAEIREKKYDYIIMSEVLEHLPQPEKALEKLKIIAHRDTEVIITVPNILFWKNRFRILFGNFDYTEEGLMDRGHIHFFSWASFKKMIWQCGYEIIKEEHHVPTRGTKALGRIWPGLFAYQFIVKIKKKRRVIYTAIFGGKDNLIEPKFIPDNFDFICFTDADLKSNAWSIKKVEQFLPDPVRCARKIKILPHRYLPDYDISIWIDGNMLVQGDVNELVEKYLKDKDVAVYDHMQLPGDARDCIYDEAETLIKMARVGGGKYKDDPKLIREQASIYKKIGYPKHNGLLSSMVMLRRHKAGAVVKTAEDWWRELKAHSRRDQLSLNYVAWKNKLDFVYMKGDSRNNKYFSRLRHKRKKNYK